MTYRRDLQGGRPNCWIFAFNPARAVYLCKTRVSSVRDERIIVAYRYNYSRCVSLERVQAMPGLFVVRDERYAWLIYKIWYFFARCLHIQQGLLPGCCTRRACRNIALEYALNIWRMLHVILRKYSKISELEGAVNKGLLNCRSKFEGVQGWCNWNGRSC